MTILDRLILRTRKAANGCIEWQGFRNRKGYGQINRGRKGSGLMLAHRAAYHLLVDEIPPGVCVLHRCDNPACVNPLHLWLGSLADNNADMMRKGRWPVGEKSGKTVFSDADIRSIRDRASKGESQREIGKEYGVTQGAISRIVTGDTWRHVS